MYPAMPNDFNIIPPTSPRRQPVIIPITIEAFILSALMPSEVIGFPIKPNCHNRGIEKVNIKEPNIHLISNSAGTITAVAETKKRDSLLGFIAAILCVWFFTYARFPTLCSTPISPVFYTSYTSRPVYPYYVPQYASRCHSYTPHTTSRPHTGQYTQNTYLFADIS